MSGRVFPWGDLKKRGAWFFVGERRRKAKKGVLKVYVFSKLIRLPSCHSLNDLQVVWETCVAHVGSKIDHTHVKK